MKLLKMKTPPVKASVIAFLSCVVCLLSSDAMAEPKTIYVDQKVETSGDGLSWKTAVKTIQEGVSKASKTEVDTILVAPGEYADEPGVSEPTSAGKYLYHRIKLDRKVILKSSEGKEVTHIVGRPGDGQGNNNPDTGLPPVTCVYIPKGGRGSIVEGFTIRDGESPNVFAASVRSAGVGDPTQTSNGDFYLNLEPQKYWYVAYCTISNCCAGRGSAVSGGTLIGTVIADNKSYNSTVATTYVHAYNCLFTRNATSAKQGAQAYALVNCLVVNDGTARGMTCVPTDQGGEAHTYSHLYNTAIFNEASSAGSWETPICSYCLLESNDGISMNIHADSDNVTPISVSDTYSNLVMSAIMGDYRPTKDGRLAGKGNKAYLALDFIPAQYRNLDFNGNMLAADAPIPIGLILPEAEPATAGVAVKAIGMKLNGRLVTHARNVHYEEVWPSVVRFTAADGCEDLFAGVSVGSYKGEEAYRKLRGKYDFVPLLLPPREDANGNPLLALDVGKVEATADHVLWVDDDAIFEGEPDGSSDKPYRTPQDAVDAAAAVAGQPFHIINVRKGVYSPNDRTKTDGTGLKACIAVGEAAQFVMRGVDGAAETFIEGAPDPDHEKDTSNTGIGPKAVRCVYAPSSANVAFVDLTFRKGYGGDTTATGKGGAFHISDKQNSHAYDCVFTDNHIHNGSDGFTLQGSCCFKGWTVRCRFTGNPKHYRGFISDTVASGCLFDGNSVGIDESYGVQQATLYNCTFYDPKMKCAVVHTSARAENCIIAAGGYVVSSKSGTADVWCQNIIWGSNTSATYAYEENEFLKADPWLAAQERGDYHPVEGSPAIGHATFDRTASNLGARLRNICTDFENESVFTADGKVTIGAFATMHEQGSIYVDANNGDDANDGKTETTAKKTLAAAAAAAATLCRKDRILALPGIYNESNMIHSVISSGVDKPLTVRARVVVPDEITLASRDGAETTIIEGAADPEPTGTAADVEHGLGPNAIRGVVLGENSVLRGFTVTKGRTSGYVAAAEGGDGYSDNVHGAGVLGRTVESSRVEDCIIMENAGACGGAGSYVTFVRCRLLDNVATRFGAAIRTGSAIDSFIDGNVGDRTCDLIYDIIGCTFGARNFRLAGEDSTMTICNPTDKRSARVWNVLSYALPQADNEIENGDVRNCIFPKGLRIYAATTPIDISNLNTNLERSAIQAFYDENGVPKNVRAPSVDLGGANDLQGETDLAGNPRVLNGAIDIGCYEADWKGQYAKDLGGRRATVTAATTNVRDVDGEVVLADGAGLALDLAANGYTVKIEFTVTDGTLTVMRGGEVFGTYTAGQTLSLNDTADLESFAFSYEGTGNATLACCKAQPGALLLVR